MTNDHDSPAASEAAETTKISVRKLNAYFDKFRAVKDIDLDIPARRVTAMIGPSGCGKSTFLRCLNRMHEQTPIRSGSAVRWAWSSRSPIHFRR